MPRTTRQVQTVIDPQSRKSVPPARTGKRGPAAGEKIFRSPHRHQIDQWLFVERRSMNEVIRLCTEQLAFPVGRDAVKNYYDNYRELTASDDAIVPGIILVDRAEQAVQNLQRLTEAAGLQLEERVDAGLLDNRELIALKKIEVQVYGARNLADIALITGRWKTAFRALMALIVQFVPPENAKAFGQAAKQHPDIKPILAQLGYVQPDAVDDQPASEAEA